MSLACEDGNSKLVEVVDDEKQFTFLNGTCGEMHEMSLDEIVHEISLNEKQFTP